MENSINIKEVIEVISEIIAIHINKENESEANSIDEIS